MHTVPPPVPVALPVASPPRLHAAPQRSLSRIGAPAPCGLACCLANVGVVGCGFRPPLPPSWSRLAGVWGFEPPSRSLICAAAAAFVVGFVSTTIQQLGGAWALGAAVQSRRAESSIAVVRGGARARGAWRRLRRLPGHPSEEGGCPHQSR